jgi:hypothetical protein
METSPQFRVNVREIDVESPFDGPKDPTNQPSEIMIGEWVALQRGRIVADSPARRTPTIWFDCNRRVALRGEPNLG